MMTEAVGMPAAMVDGMAAQPFWAALEQIGHTVAYDGRIMDDTMRGNADALDVFSTVSVPTLVMSGGGSPAWLTAAAEQLASRLPTSTMELLPGQTHQVDPAVLATATSAHFTPLLTDATR